MKLIELRLRKKSSFGSFKSFNDFVPRFFLTHDFFLVASKPSFMASPLILLPQRSSISLRLLSAP